MTKQKLNLDLLDEDSAFEAIEMLGKLADQNNIERALVGSVALNLYRSDRLTKELILSLQSVCQCRRSILLGNYDKRGGERYQTVTAKKTAAVDSILRNDEFKVLFQAALKESVKIDDIPILRPKWLVILTFTAGRFKDQEDAVFLLSRKDLVDRNLIKEKIIEHLGRAAWELARHGYQRWFDIADGRTCDEEPTQMKAILILK